MIQFELIKLNLFTDVKKLNLALNWNVCFNWMNAVFQYYFRIFFRFLINIDGEIELNISRYN